MKLSERSFMIARPQPPGHLLEWFGQHLRHVLDPGELPVRFVVSSTDEHYHCEVAVITQADQYAALIPSIFHFRPRQYENNSQFNVVMVIPTGIDCEIGGHAGDATPAARVLAALCDHLIIHPNIVNSSDINELSENCLMVEGSVLARLLMGTIGLQEVRANRVLVVLQEMDNPHVTQAAINSVSAARATLGMNSVGVVCLRQCGNAYIEYASCGRASGSITDMETLLEVLLQQPERYDAVALVTQLDSAENEARLMRSYYVENSVNPWGGIEAMFSHALSLMLNKPIMHSPIMVSDEPLRFGVVDPRKASEVVSRTYMHCILKGVHRSPRVISQRQLFGKPGILTVEDIHALVVPEGTLGLPTLAALEQGIPVIAVRENRNLMRNKLETLPFAPGKYYLVDNYLEAGGLLAALKAGVDPSAVRRPLLPTSITEIRPISEAVLA